MKFNWNSIKSVLLHTGSVFAVTFATTEAATGYSVSKSAVVSAVVAAGTAALHYLSGLLPNGTVSLNRAFARRSTDPTA